MQETRIVKEPDIARLIPFEAYRGRAFGNFSHKAVGQPVAWSHEAWIESQAHCTTNITPLRKGDDARTIW